MDKLLEKYGIKPGAKPLGEGIEAVVYAYEDSKVIRIYKKSAKSTLDMVTRAKHFYDSLDDSGVSFKVPKIITVHEDEGIVYTIDKRLHGVELSTAFGMLNTSSKDKVLTSYMHAAEQVCNLTDLYDYYGEVLFPSPVRASTWAEFLSIKLQTAYRKGKEDVEEDLPNYKAVIDDLKSQAKMFSDVDEPKLVHGDFYVANVLVEEEAVSAVIDFNNLTLAGDPRMDIASAIIFLGDSGTGTRDPERLALISELTKKYGDAIREIVHFYKMYYAVLFAASAKESDPTTYQWAIATMEDHLSGEWKY